jgi:hypothetical protein
MVKECNEFNGWNVQSSSGCDSRTGTSARR